MGYATVSGWPSSSTEKVNFTTDTQHMETISSNWKLAVWRLLPGARRLIHTYVQSVCMHEALSTQRVLGAQILYECMFVCLGENVCVTCTRSVFDVCSCYSLFDS